MTSVKSNSQYNSARREGRSLDFIKTPQDLTHKKHRSGKDEGRRVRVSGTVGNRELVKPDTYSVMTSNARLG